MKLSKHVLFLAISLLPTIANAAFPVGEWTVSTYLVSTGAHWNTFDVCVKANKTWYLIEQASGKGSWYQKNGDDDIHLHGNIGTLNESIELKQITSTLSTGFWQQWSDNNATSIQGVNNLYTTTTWTFKSAATCRPAF